MILESLPPTDSLQNLADEFMRIKDNLKELYSTDTELNVNEIVLTARQNIAYQSNWKDDTVVRKFWEECSEYIHSVEQAKSENRLLCDKNTFDRASQYADQLSTGKYTQEYFSDKYQHFNQVEIFWSLDGVEFKSKLDKVIVDPTSKIITLVDVKTYNGDFVSNYYNYFYWLQAIMYKAPFEIIESRKISLFNDDKFSVEINKPNRELLEIAKNTEYKLSPAFIFLTVDTSDFNVPTAFTTSKNALECVNSISMIHKDTRDILYFDGWWNKAKQLWQHIQENQWIEPLELVNTKHISL